MDTFININETIKELTRLIREIDLELKKLRGES